MFRKLPTNAKPESKVAAAGPLQGQVYTRFVSLRSKRYIAVVVRIVRLPVVLMTIIIIIMYNNNNNNNRVQG